MESIVRNPGRDASPLVLSCSPRKGGNSDAAAEALARGLASAGVEARVTHLRDHAVLPCRGCQACARSVGHACVLMERDEAEALFALIVRAPMLFFTAPIYFYHLPGAFKGFIDRAQRYYAAQLAGDPVLNALEARQAFACLVSGRPRGEKLFEGSLLTLRYFLKPFNAALAEPLCLPGFDGPGDLAGDEATLARVASYASDAWNGAAP